MSAIEGAAVPRTASPKLSTVRVLISARPKGRNARLRGATAQSGPKTTIGHRTRHGPDRERSEGFLFPDGGNEDERLGDGIFVGDGEVDLRHVARRREVREPAGRSEYRSVAIRCGRNASIQLWVSVVCSSETLPYPAAVMIVLRTFTWNRAAGRSWKVLTQIASNRRS